MVTFGERIRALAIALGKDEQVIAQDLGLTKSQLSHYINGRRKVPSDLLQQIVDVFNINPLFLFRENEPLFERKNLPSRYYDYLPANISAGLPHDVEGITDSEKINLPDTVMGKWAGNKDIYITKINGDSMNKIMPDQSLIAVKPINLLDLKNGDLVVFSDNYDYSVKRYVKREDKLIFKPESTNTDHDEQHYSFDDNITIHGKVVLYIVEMD